MSKANQFLIKIIGKTINLTSTVAPRFASKKALKLFATPRKGRYTENQIKVINGAGV